MAQSNSDYQLIAIFEKWLPYTTMYKLNEKRWSAQNRANKIILDKLEGNEQADAIMVKEMVRDYFDVALAEEVKNYRGQMGKIQLDTDNELRDLQDTVHQLNAQRDQLKKELQQADAMLEERRTTIKAAEQAGRVWTTKQLLMRAAEFGFIGLVVGLCFTLGALIWFHGFTIDNWLSNFIMLCTGAGVTSLVSWVLWQHRLAVLNVDPTALVGSTLEETSGKTRS